MKAEGRCSGMRKKLKRIFLIVLAVIMLLSLISMPCQAEFVPSCDCSKSKYEQDETIRCTAIFKNDGLWDQDYEIKIWLYDPNNRVVEYDRFEGYIKRGEVKSIPMSYSSPEGGWEPGGWWSFCFRVFGDYEKMPAKHCCVFQVEELPRPDLVITDIWSVGNAIYYEIKNVGNKRAGESKTSLTIDEAFIKYDYVAPLEPGERETGSFYYSWNCTNKSDKIEVCADHEDEVEEKYEWNNCLTETWTCKDLLITDIWSDNNTIHYKIENTGYGRAGESKTNLTIDGVFKASDYVAPLEPGEERTESFNYSWTCTNKSDEIKVCADYEDDVEESNEENNCRTETWICKDLVITDVWAENSTIYYKIKNTGYKRAEESSTSLTIDDVFKASDHVAPLEPIEERTESFDYKWICRGKSDEIEVCADYEDDVEEGDEENNCITETWTCPPPDIWVSPTSFNVTLPLDVVTNYTLTVGNKGNSMLDFNVLLTTRADIDIPDQQGWPRYAGFASDVDSSPALGDIDGDGDIEIVVGSRDGKVYAWHHDGSTVKGWPRSTGTEVISSPALGDIDGDGDLEIVVGSSWWNGGKIGGKLYVWHHNGSIVEGWPKKAGSYDGFSTPALGDIDRDGDLEIVVGENSISSGISPIYAWHHNGSLVEGWPKTTGGSIWSSPALGDIDGDGDIEIVVGSDKVYAWHHDGSNVTGWPRGGGGYSSPALGDIDGDGDIEIVVGSDKVYAWHHDGSNVTGWPRGGDGYSSPALGDIDGDGDIEIVVGSVVGSDKVYAWHHDGYNVTGWPVKTSDYAKTSPTLGDIDGDGGIEVIVGSEDGKVYAWHHGGSLVEGWPKEYGGAISSPALGDIDGDGDIEVVVGSYSEVCAGDCSGIYNPNNIEWGTFHHDIMRTGLYEPKPSGGFWLSVYPTSGTLEPGNQTNITVTFNTTGIPPGEYHVNITITSNDPDENLLSIPVRLTVPQPPDLNITDIWIDNNTIYYKIKNTGDEKAGESNTSLTIDDVFIISDYIALLEPGEMRTESFDYTWNCTDENDVIKVCADYEDDVEEYNETNNCLTETRLCEAPAIWVSPVSFDVGLQPEAVLNYALTIDNKGNDILDFNILLTTRADIDIPYQQGWPRRIWDDKVISSPALGDIDGDGDIEVVVGSYKGKVYVWHHNGSTVKGWPRYTGGEIHSSPALGDIDGDGDIEVVVGSSWDGGKRGKIYVWHHNGSIVKGWPKKAGSYDDFSTPALGDIDGDGDLEIVVGLYHISSEQGKVYAWHHDGSTVKGWPKYTGDGVSSSPALGDIDGDGDMEVVVGSYDNKVYAWHHNGSTVKGWPRTTGDGVVSSPVLGDIDGDGDLEIVVGSWDDKVYAWHHDGSIVEGWPKTTGRSIWSSPALGDMDKDGDIEVFICSYDGKVYAWHHNGSTVKGWPKTTDSDIYSSYYSPALGDIDGSGDIEIVVGSDDKVYAWHHDGSNVTRWPKKTGDYVPSPALGDIDGDGDIEVVVGSYDKVYVWDCSGIYNPNNIEWGTFHHDVMRTGLYEPKPSGGFWLSVYPTSGTLEPGNQTNITVTFNTTGIPPGEYHVNITITSNDPDENLLSIPVKLRVTIPQLGSIQYAVDAASPGDTIIVKDGTYTENVYVNKRLTIISENGSANCTVQAAERSEDVFHIAADYVNISGFTIRRAYDAAGIRIESDFCNVSNNICSNNIDGINIRYSNNNSITNNDCSYNRFGIYLSNSNNNSIINNNCSKNKYDGVRIDGSSNNKITNNNICSNHDKGILLYESSNDNKIYLNNFLNNTDNVHSYSSTNIWNSTEKIKYTYKGSEFENYLGNYWSDYTGSDTDGDGIGDIPYSIDGDKDNYPLMERFENFRESLAPDLTVTNITWSPSDILPSDTVTFTVTVKNIGKGNTTSNFYLRFEIDGSFVGRKEVLDGLTANESLSVSWNWTASPGNHSVKAIADEYNSVNESNETNNVLTKTLPIIPAPPEVTVLSPDGGEFITGMHNITWNATSEHFPKEDLRVKIELFDGYSYIPIAENLTNTGIYHWDTTTVNDGSYMIKVAATDPKGLNASDTSDGWFTVCNSDLSLSNFSFSPVLPCDGEIMTFTAVIDNVGAKNVSTFSIRFELDRNFIGRKTIPGLTSNNSIEINQTWQVTPGNHTVKVIADEHNDVAEYNETNNELLVQLPEIPFSDLTVANITWSPSNFSDGQIVTFNAVIENIGENTTRSFYIRFLIDNSSIGEKRLSGLASGSSLNISQTWSASVGEHNVTVVADCYNNISESDESNNSLTLLLGRVEYPDLTISNITWDPTVFSDGDIVTFNATIKNIGTGNTSRTFYTIFYIDGVSIGGKYLNGLAAGSSVYITQSWIATPGNHTLKVKADSNNQVLESNETNNSLKLNLTTQAGIDTSPPLVINPASTPSSIIADGVQESQLNVTVTDESGIASVTVNLSVIGGLPNQEMNNIPGTDIYTVNTTAAAGTAPGTYYLQVNATDVYGNSNTSVSIALTVKEEEEGDTLPPTIVSVTLDAYISPPDSTIHVTVNATDNVGVTSVTADGVALVETGSIWEGNITAPSSTGEYTLTIRAEDAAGNYNETTVDYSVVKPSGSIGLGIDPRLTTVNENDTAIINITLVSTENFDDIAYVYLTTEGVYPDYEANLTWFNWISKYVKVPGGATVKVPLKVNIPAGESGYKVFYAKLESTKWTPTAMDTGVLYII